LVSTVRPRPNHYETLGLTPTAAGDEIAKAFARETSVLRPHAFGGIAEACIAYEILRDPIKRRAYDASIGLEPVSQQRAFSSDPPTEPTAFRALSPYPVQRSTIDATLSVASRVNPALRPEPRAERAPAAFDAATPRQPIDRPDRDTTPGPVLNPEPRLRQETATKPRLGLQTGESLSDRLALEEHLGVKASPVDWKSTGMIAGGLAAATCLLGAVAGWWSAGDIATPNQPENAVSVPLPPAKPLAIAEVQKSDSANYATEARPDRPGRAAVEATRLDRTPALPQPAAAENFSQDNQPQENLPAEGEPDLSAVAQGDALAPLEPTAAASMPLPNKVIARTIERIGYSCGSVASTSPVEGDAPGVFKITCASGQSYQAKPVNGRYRFRRWGRQ
jgi:hypothetical protein